MNDRRWVTGIFSLGVLAAAVVFAAGGCAKKTPTLSLLVWEGYADPSYIRAFEESHNCKVSASYMGSSDELVAKLRGGSASNYDVISPSSDVATMIASSGLAAPLDLAKLPSYAQLSERLRNMPLVRVNGNVYGVPFTWGPNPLLYDTTYFPKPPDSWAVLWDPKLKGKISAWDELSTIYMAAQVLGLRQARPGSHLQSERRGTGQRAQEIDRAQAEHSQVLVHRRRTDESVSKITKSWPPWAGR